MKGLKNTSLSSSGKMKVFEHSSSGSYASSEKSFPIKRPFSCSVKWISLVGIFTIQYGVDRTIDHFTHNSSRTPGDPIPDLVFVLRLL